MALLLLPHLNLQENARWMPMTHAEYSQLPVTLSAVYLTPSSVFCRYLPTSCLYLRSLTHTCKHTHTQIKINNISRNDSSEVVLFMTMHRTHRHTGHEVWTKSVSCVYFFRPCFPCCHFQSVHRTSESDCSTHSLFNDLLCPFIYI